MTDADEQPDGEAPRATVDTRPTPDEAVAAAASDPAPPRRPAAPRDPAAPIAFEHFLPYRLSVLANTVSRVLATLYERHYDLSVAEWRLLAILARFEPLSANDVCRRSAMDKVRVSRAVSRAVDRGLVRRDVDAQDRRRSVLSLTPAGRALHDRIMPQARAREAAILAALTPEEVDRMYDLLDRLQAAADRLDPGAAAAD